MSYALLGLGAAESKFSASVTPTGLAANAFVTLKKTPGLLESLSPQSQIFAMVKGGALDSALNENILSISSDLVTHISSSIGELATDIVKDVAGVVPILGDAINLIASLWESDAKAKERFQQEFCGNQYKSLAAIPTGTNPTRIVPADLFSYSVPPSGPIEGGGSGYGWRMPLIGSQLISITETPLSMDSKGSWYWDYADYDRLVSGAKLYATLYTGLSPVTAAKFGVSKERRAIFQQLRRAIQAQWRPTYTNMSSGNVPRCVNNAKGNNLGPVGGCIPFPAEGESDGGSALMSVYMDLIAQEYKAGRIGKSMISYFDNHMVLNDGSVVQLGGAAPQPGCPEATWAFIANWVNNMNPSYSMDMAEFNRLKEEARVALLRATTSRLSSVSVASKFAAAAAAPKPKSVAAPLVPKKMSPVAAVAIGAGVMAVGAIGYMEWKKRKKRASA